MNLSEVALWADVIQAVAVVATLIFVGFQVRHNSLIARMTAAQTSAQLLTENLGRVIDHPHLADLLTRPDEEYHQLSPGDRLRISNFLAASFRHIEVLHAHRRYEIYEEELWQGAASRMRVMLENPLIRDWWTNNKPHYAKSFQEHMRAEIETVLKSNSMSA
ncbi:DUF6082 family protein [Hyphococcus sp.]|uniref:DUF6082 family protein n=1 Tax=Hyphococcus sp. TaxID=2038636 RepID=UPI0020888D90|nr:MAG: hypothetical protein DHS20C04_16390 [Marinicaulis sp.]